MFFVCSFVRTWWVEEKQRPCTQCYSLVGAGIPQGKPPHALATWQRVAILILPENPEEAWYVQSWPFHCRRSRLGCLLLSLLWGEFSCCIFGSFSCSIYRSRRYLLPPNREILQLHRHPSLRRHWAWRQRPDLPIRWQPTREMHPELQLHWHLGNDPGTLRSSRKLLR